MADKGVADQRDRAAGAANTAAHAAIDLGRKQSDIITEATRRLA